MKLIQSRENPFFKELLKIAASARNRKKTGKTLLDGTHLIASFLDAGCKPLHVLLNVSSEGEEMEGLKDRLQGVPVTVLDGKLFSELSELKTSTEMLALIEVQRPEPAAFRFGLLLEDIQDPGNLGSILRSGAAAGCDAVFLSRGCADAWSPKVLRAAMGGHFFTRIYEAQDLSKVAASFQGMKLATSLHARASLYECDLSGNLAFMLGNEGAGLSEGLLKLATHEVKIPMPGGVESLNVAAAAAVCLFETVRQRLMTGRSK